MIIEIVLVVLVKVQFDYIGIGEFVLLVYVNPEYDPADEIGQVEQHKPL